MVYATGSHCLLHPQSVSVEMAQFAEALPGAHTDGSGGTGPYTDWEFMAEILEQALHAEGDARAADHTIELGLATAQGHAWLGGRSALQGVPAHEHAPATGAFSGPWAPGPICTSVHTNGVDDLPIE